MQWLVAVTSNSQFIGALLHHLEEKPIKALPCSPSVDARQTCKQEAMTHISEQISPAVSMKGKPSIWEPTCVEMNLHQASDGQFHQWDNLLYVKTIRFGVFRPEAAAAELELPGAGSWAVGVGVPSCCRAPGSWPWGGQSHPSGGDTHCDTQVDTSSAAEAPAVAPHHTVQSKSRTGSVPNPPHNSAPSSAWLPREAAEGFFFSLINQWL